MKIEINRLNNHLLMEAMNEDGQKVVMDGESEAMRPMQMLLSALGGCSTIDVVLILKKQREPIEDIKVVINGDRYEDRVPKTFKHIHIHYIIKGKVNLDKAKRAVELSMEKYCSVSMMLKDAVEIEYSFEVVESFE
ncbi:MAG: putative redox protein [Saprospiraceae bacterium]|jgi:putative redox protein